MKDEEEIMITVSAAASLKDALYEIGEHFQKDNPQIEVRFNFGASGSLSEQIKQGAPVDVFLSASEEKFQELVGKDLIDNKATLVSNEIVLISTSKTDFNLKELSDITNEEIEKISIGTPSIVPAGTYAQQALEYYDVWQDIQEKIVYAKDVRQVTTYVETGNVQVGIVYKTDAMASDKVEIFTTIDAKSHDAITYPAGVLKSSKNKEESLLFFDYLQNDAMKKVWVQYGFSL